MDKRDFIFLPIFIFLMLVPLIQGRDFNLFDIIGALAFSFVIEWLLIKYILKNGGNNDSE